MEDLDKPDVSFDVDSVVVWNASKAFGGKDDRVFSLKSFSAEGKMSENKVEGEFHVSLNRWGLPPGHGVVKFTMLPDEMNFGGNIYMREGRLQDFLFQLKMGPPQNQEATLSGKLVFIPLHTLPRLRKHFLSQQKEAWLSGDVSYKSKIDKQAYFMPFLGIENAEVTGDVAWKATSFGVLYQDNEFRLRGSSIKVDKMDVYSLFAMMGSAPEFPGFSIEGGFLRAP